MKITIDHPENLLIMDWLFDNYEVRGDEEYLLNEPIGNPVPQSDLWKLETYLFEQTGEEVTVSKDCKFIEIQ